MSARVECATCPRALGCIGRCEREPNPDNRTLPLDLLGPEPTTECHWTEDADGAYATDCGNLFVLTADTPRENGMRWCCYCGKQLHQVLFADTELVTLPAPLAGVQHA